MKGQFTWDYLVSIIAFIVLVSYLSLQVIGRIPLVSNSIRSEFLRSEAYQISELLLNNPGEPPSWTPANVRRVGLANASFNVTNYISSSKITALNSLCTNYDNLVGNLSIDIKKYNISVLVFSKTVPGPPLVNCKPSVVLTRAVNVTIARYAAIDSGGYAELIVQAW